MLTQRWEGSQIWWVCRFDPMVVKWIRCLCRYLFLLAQHRKAKQKLVKIKNIYILDKLNIFSYEKTVGSRVIPSCAPVAFSYIVGLKNRLDSFDRVLYLKCKYLSNWYNICICICRWSLIIVEKNKDVYTVMLIDIEDFNELSFF